MMNLLCPIGPYFRDDPTEILTRLLRNQPKLPFYLTTILTFFLPSVQHLNSSVCICIGL